MSARLILLPAASADIDQIYGFIAGDSLAAAERFYAAVRGDRTGTAAMAAI